MANMMLPLHTIRRSTSCLDRPALTKNITLSTFRLTCSHKGSQHNTQFPSCSHLHKGMAILELCCMDAVATAASSWPAARIQIAGP
jgi:hypothetical protein